MLKTLGSEVKQLITEIAARAVGYYGLPFQPEALNPYGDVVTVGPETAITAMPSYLNERAATIYSGSSEVQRNVLAKRVLGL
jgi:alkylation response protein AidB-like acyl-CoA dehydrogenase